jgi:predicted nucleic-acid-binding Zn-ribbon protein
MNCIDGQGRRQVVGLVGVAFAKPRKLSTRISIAGDETMAASNFHCAKCANQEYETSEFRATGGFLSKIFDIQSRKFTTVTCTRCKYTEIYKADSSALGNIFDLFT